MNELLRIPRSAHEDSKPHSSLQWSLTACLIEQLVVPTFVLDRQGIVIAWNRACERLTALPAAQVIGTREHWRGFYDHPRPCLSDVVLRDLTEELGALYVTHRQIAAHESAVTAENWCAMPIAGSVRYLVIDAAPLLADDGELLGVVETLRDTTEQKVAEMAAGTHRRQLDIALNNMAHGLSMFDKDGRLVLANGRYAEVYGVKADRIRPGMTQREILAERVAAGSYAGDPDAFVREIMEIFASHRSVERVVELVDGRFIAVRHGVLEEGGWVSTHEDITSRREVEQRIAYMAHHDALTGLPNRVLLRERLVQAMAGADRGHAFALLYVDLDHFKTVNDTLGHPAGDALLKAVAGRLRAELRDTDTFARVGGDEFVVLQAASDQPQASRALARRLIDVLARPYGIDGHQVVIGASIGIALAPSDGADADVLLKNADLALYRAKANGRGASRFFEPEMDACMQTRRALELDLRVALAAGEFEVYYQPLVDLRGRYPTSFEALLRWHHPKRGLVSPLDFIPLAEEIGIIGEIGEWVLHRACADAARWANGTLRVAVNLSAQQFRPDGDIAGVVTRALERSKLEAARLELEITEGVLLQDTDECVATLHRLRGLGVTISMDDFGTGYSSLSYLRRFPFDKVKIDQSFVRGMVDDNGDCKAIVRAIIGLCDNLGIRTTAEGVETNEQRELLLEVGCTEAQGFLFSRPIPGSGVAGFLKVARAES